ncbi:MAG: thiosulfate oxidation carrier protein SoxY [Minwuia sp.]|uniref:thiosulfate oxidation carrier protein SoxY n=1 Tax=Minwuia sp. TaxID=2493630 RepID=UPI003A8B14AE
MKLNRREALALGAGALFISLTPFRGGALANTADEEIKAFTGGADVVEDNIVTLTAPEIAENGNTVPITISVDSPMTADNYVKRVRILADGNPRSAVATMHFSPMSGTAEANTRMRLAKTQNVIAIAELSDGTFHMSKAEVKVTIGGCGG